MTDIDALIERLKHYAVLGPLPSLSIHPEAMGFTTGRVLGDTADAAAALAEQREEIARLMQTCDQRKALLDLYVLGGWVDAERLMQERDALLQHARAMADGYDHYVSTADHEGIEAALEAFRAWEAEHGKANSTETKRRDDVEPVAVLGSRPPNIDIKQLLRFYGVSSLEDLVMAQDRHIARLQAQLPPNMSQQPRTPREG